MEWPTGYEQRHKPSEAESPSFKQGQWLVSQIQHMKLPTYSFLIFTFSLLQNDYSINANDPLGGFFLSVTEKNVLILP
jgi:hypothetical protein